jgi:exodeoxyribonuclease-3
MKFASWNVNSLNVRLPHVLTWLAEPPDGIPVDVIGLQELKMVDEKFPLAAIQAAGFDAYFMGQKTYNGVAILVRQAAQFTISNIICNNPLFVDEQKRLIAIDIATPIGSLKLINVYIPNGQAVGSDKYAYKLAWLTGLHQWLGQVRHQTDHVLLMGDFNIAPHDDDVHDPAAWQDKILCSAPEREAFSQLLQLGLVDSFRACNPTTRLFSWWDYRMNGYKRNLGLRIDLLLASPSLLNASTHSPATAMIDIMPREWVQPSDHAPALLIL